MTLARRVPMTAVMAVVAMMTAASMSGPTMMGSMTSMVVTCAMVELGASRAPLLRAVLGSPVMFVRSRNWPANEDRGKQQDSDDENTGPTQPRSCAVRR